MQKTNYNPFRRSAHWFRDLPLAEKDEYIRTHPAYGKIVCRCEGVSEGEILETLELAPPASVCLSAGKGIRYTVPQRISSTAAGVQVYFRVDRIYRDAEVQVTQGGRILYAKRRAVLTPGGMETVTLTRQTLKACGGGTLEFHLEEERRI